MPNITGAKTPKDMPRAVGGKGTPPDGGSTAGTRMEWQVWPQGGLAGRGLHMPPQDHKVLARVSLACVTC